MSLVLEQPETRDLDTSSRLPQGQRRARARDYADALIAGMSLDELSASEGISASYMRSVVVQAGLWPEVRAARRRRKSETETSQITAREARARERHAEQGRRWADAVIAGETLDQIGVREGLSRERIRQVIALAGLTDEVYQAKAAKRAARHMAQREAVKERARERKLSVGHGTRGPRRWTEEAIVEAVRVWLEAGGGGRGTDWVADGMSPSVALVTQRVGWAKAIRLAGGVPKNEGHKPRIDRWSERECLSAMVAYLSDPSTVTYVEWARGRNVPSVATINNRFGTWGTAKRLALDWMQMERGVVSAEPPTEDMP